MKRQIDRGCLFLMTLGLISMFTNDSLALNIYGLICFAVGGIFWVAFGEED